MITLSSHITYYVQVCRPSRYSWFQEDPLIFQLTHPRCLICLPGLNRTSTFSCEAHNHKGVATSGSGTITGRCNHRSLLKYTFPNSSLFFLYLLFLFFSSPFSASGHKSCGDYSVQSSFVMGPWFWGWLPNNPLFCSGTTVFIKADGEKKSQLAEEKKVCATVWPACQQINHSSSVCEPLTVRISLFCESNLKLKELVFLIFIHSLPLPALFTYSWIRFLSGKVFSWTNLLKYHSLLDSLPLLVSLCHYSALPTCSWEEEHFLLEKGAMQHHP